MFSPSQYTIKTSTGLVTIDLTEAPEEMLHALLRQGVAILFQRVTARGADAKMSDRERAQAYDALARELNAGTWRPGASGGAARLSDEEREFRSLLADAFVAAGVKKSDALRYAAREDREAYYRDVVILPAIRRVDPSATGKAPGIVTAHFVTLAERAAALVAARREAAPELSLDLD